MGKKKDVMDYYNDLSAKRQKLIDLSDEIDTMANQLPVRYWKRLHKLAVYLRKIAYFG